MQISAAASRRLIEEITEQSYQLLLPAGYSGVAPQLMVSDLAQRFLSSEAYRVGNVESILSSFSFCYKYGIPELCGELVDRALRAASSSPSYMSKVLVPLLPALCTWARHRRRDMDAALHTILTHVLEDALGNSLGFFTNLAEQVARLSGWECSCQPCKATNGFITDTNSDTITLDGIGAGPRRHVEHFLESYASGLATWSVLRGRSMPQSLKVCSSIQPPM